MGFGVGDDIGEAFGHDGVETLVDLGLGPEVAHAVLHPLEVAGGDAAGVGEDVGDDEDSLFGEDVVGDHGGGAIGALAEDAAAQVAGVAAGDDVFAGGGDKDLALARDEFSGIGGLGPGKAGDGPGLGAMREESGNVDAGGVEEAAIDFSDADD